MDESNYLYLPYHQSIDALNKFYSEINQYPIPDKVYLNEIQETGLIQYPTTKPAIESELARSDASNVTIQRISQLKDEQKRTEEVYREETKELKKELKSVDSRYSPPEKRKNQSDKKESKKSTRKRKYNQPSDLFTL